MRPSAAAHLTSLALLFLAPAWAASQTPAAVPADPDMPRKAGFDTDRAIFWAERNFDPLRDPEWTLLRDALRSGHVSETTPVVVFEVAGRKLVLVSSQMSYHHVAQGEMEGEPWMVTF